MFTDGIANIEQSRTRHENVLLKNIDDGKTLVVTTSVGFPGFVDTDTTRSLASDPATRNSFRVVSYKWIGNMTNPVLNAVCAGNMS